MISDNVEVLENFYDFANSVTSGLGGGQCLSLRLKSTSILSFLFFF